MRKLSDRIRDAAGPASAERSELAAELASIESRALEAEATLVQEREVYTQRVKEMEEKLRKLEPWLRRLRSEYQVASDERDQLRDRIATLERDLSAGAARSTEADSALAVEREAAHREAEAAVAARDAALAEVASLRQRLENDLRTLQESWRQRIETAEASRDKALDESKQMRQQLGVQRRTEEEIKRLLKQVEQADTTTSVHKAVARAAQEEAEGLRARLTELEKHAGRNSEEAKVWIARAEEAMRALESAEAELQQIRDENAAVSLRLASAESAVRDVRTENERVRAEIGERDRALGGARGEIDTLKKTLEKLRAEVTEARQTADRHKADAADAKHELDSNVRELERLKSETAAARKRAQEETDQVRREAAEQRELAEEAMRAEEQARKEVADAAEKLAAESRAHGDARARLHELESKVDQAQLELADARQALEQTRAARDAFEAEKANLLRSLEEERSGAAKRHEAAEASWKSQMRAAEGRFDADLQRERQRAAAAEDGMAALQTRHAAEVADLHRLRSNVAESVRMKAHELLEVVARLSGTRSSEPSVEVEVAPEFAESMPPAQPNALDPSDFATTAATEWDRVLSDVQALRSEVEGMRSTGDDTASVTVEESPPAGAAAHADADAPIVETTPKPVTTPVAADHADDDSRGGRRRRRR